MSLGNDNEMPAGPLSESVPTVTATGHFTVKATGSVDWRLPVIHAETAWGDLPVEVVTDENGRLLGARLHDWQEIPENGVSVDYEIWGVTARITEPLPVVVLHHGSMHEGTTEFHYTIDPPDYPALATDMVFSENGHDVLVAGALGSGTGTMTLGPGVFFTDPAAPHTVRMRLNHGWGWWMGSELVRMGMGYGGQALVIIAAEIKSISFVDGGVGFGGDNEHTLFENSVGIGGWAAGPVIEDPVWVTDGPDEDSDPDRNKPVCYLEPAVLCFRWTSTIERRYDRRGKNRSVISISKFCAPAGSQCRGRTDA